jgi:osmotically-inducible protein OsmY
MRTYVYVALAGCLALSCSKTKPGETAYDQRYPRSGAYQTGAYQTDEEQQMRPASGVVYEKETVIEEYNANEPSDPLAQPVEQGTSVDDQRTTEKIRMALEQDDTLSNEAKNVKVITLHQKVTLRGPVPSMDEAQRIEAHAKTVAGADNVYNQLSIKKPQ